MTSVTLDEARRDLTQLVADVLTSSEPCVVVTESGEQVVVMRMEDFHSWNETAYLVGNPANAAHLRRGMAEVDTRQHKSHELLAE